MCSLRPNFCTRPGFQHGLDFSIPGAAAELLSIQADRFHCTHAVKSPGTLSFPGDLPGFWPFSRKVGRFAAGPSLFRGLFKEGLCAFIGTFQDFGLFQGRSAGLQRDLPYFEGFSRMVAVFLPGPSMIFAFLRKVGKFAAGPSLFRGLFKEGRRFCCL